MTVLYRLSAAAPVIARQFGADDAAATGGGDDRKAHLTGVDGEVAGVLTGVAPSGHERPGARRP